MLASHRQLLEDAALDALLLGATDAEGAGGAVAARAVHVLLGQPIDQAAAAWPLAVETMRRARRPERHTVRLMQQLITAEHVEKDAVLLELGLLLLAGGRVQEAYEHFSARVFQHNASPLLHGYCGTIAHALRRDEVLQGASQQYASTQLALGLDHFDRYRKACAAQAPAVAPDVAFVALHCELLYAAGHVAELHRLLAACLEQRPQDALLPRLALQYDMPDRHTLWRRALALDPCAPSETVFAPLVHHLHDRAQDARQSDTERASAAVELAGILAERLDYFGEDESLWQALALTLPRLSPDDRGKLGARYVSYWPERHFIGDDTLSDARRACLFELFGHAR